MRNLFRLLQIAQAELDVLNHTAQLSLLVLPSVEALLEVPLDAMYILRHRHSESLDPLLSSVRCETWIMRGLAASDLGSVSFNLSRYSSLE
jgi:hypothetical protein